MCLGLIFLPRFSIIIIVVICAITQRAVVNFAETLCNHSVIVVYIIRWIYNSMVEIVVTAARLRCTLYL